MSSASDEPKAAETTSPDAEGVGGVTGRIDKMKEAVADLAKARSAGRLVRFLVVLLVLLVILGAGLRAYGMYARVANNWPAYEREIVKGLRTEVLPEAHRELRGVAEALAPVYRKAVQEDWAKNRAKILDELEKQAALFRKNAARNLEKDFHAALQKLVKGYEAKLTKAFPKLEDADVRARVLQSLTDALIHSSAQVAQKSMTDTLALIAEIHHESMLFIRDPNLRRRFNEATRDLFKDMQGG